ncbi:MAG: RluA family pseudouridine synthase [Candidatus Altimarinota bacterium]
MKQFTITENDAGQRLDKFLKKIFPNASASLVYKINRKNKIKINGKKQDNEYKLQVGEEIKIFLNDDEFQTLSQKQEVKKEESREKFDTKNIVYEDGDILVINKEPGINVHPGDYKTKESNIISQIQDYLGDKLNSLTFKPSLVHRIDRDTSGILIIGKKKNILTKLVADFKEHKKIQKVYYAIVLGKLPASSGKIDKKLLRIEGAKNEDKVQISEKGQVAISHYKVLKEHTIKTASGQQIISEVEVEILTGRMHQIRVHMASLGTPILGDNKYGDKAFNSYVAKNFGLTRQALHAWKIQFFHYGKQKNQRLEAKIKKDLTKILNEL